MMRERRDLLIVGGLLKIELINVKFRIFAINYFGLDLIGGDFVEKKLFDVGRYFLKLLTKGSLLYDCLNA